MQQCTMHNATIQKTTFYELGVYTIFLKWDLPTQSNVCVKHGVSRFKLQSVAPVILCDWNPRTLFSLDINSCYCTVVIVVVVAI